MKHIYNLEVGNKVFTSGTHIMGILNVTPDSFYSSSRVSSNNILNKAKYMIENGAEILDIGGQSTRPNSKKVSPIEELSRVLPAVEKIKENFDIPVSVDTFYPQVAEEVLKIGADMINDVSCYMYDELPDIIAKYNAAVCVMHDRRRTNFPIMMIDKSMGLQEAITKSINAGIKPNKILLDAGIGFNKSKDEDWELLNHYDELINEFSEYPFLLGTSRKSMFGGDVTERLPQTIDSTIKAVKYGVLFVRVHDVKENMMAIQTYKD